MTAVATAPNVPVSELTLILVNFVVAGLEIASSVAFTFIPPLLLKSGYSETQMSIIFGVGKPYKNTKNTFKMHTVAKSNDLSEKKIVFEKLFCENMST